MFDAVLVFGSVLSEAQGILSFDSANVSCAHERTFKYGNTFNSLIERVSSSPIGSRFAFLSQRK